MGFVQTTRRSTSNRLLISAAVLSAVTITTPAVASAATGFSVSTPTSTVEAETGFLTFDKQTSADQKWLVPSGNWYFSVNTNEINAGLKNPTVHAIYVNAYGRQTTLTFSGDGTQTFRGDRGVTYKIQVSDGEITLFNGGSNASMDIPVRTTQTTYFKDTNGNDILNSVVQNNAIVGQHYETANQVIPGYTLVDTPVNATGTVSNQKTTYIVGTTTTEPLYDDNGYQWAIATKTITDAAGSVTETLQVTDKFGNPISGVLRPAERGSIAPGSYGTFANLSRYGAPYATLYLTNHNIEPDTVTYTYKKNQESAKIVFRTPDGSPIGNDQIITGSYGDTPSYTPPTIPGYKLTKVPTFKPFDDGDTPTYEFIYTPDTEKVTVLAVLIDQNGNSVKELPVAKSEYTGDYGTDFKIGKPTLVGDDSDNYEYAGADTSDTDYYDASTQTVSGRYTDNGNTITFYYREVAKPETPSTPDTPSETTPSTPDTPSETTPSTPDTPSETTPEVPSKPVTKNPDMTTPPSKIKSTVVVDYVSNGHNLDNPPTFTVTGDPDGDYTFEVPDIPGYTPRIDGTPTTTGTHTGKYPHTGAFVNIVVDYVPNEQTITVHHVDEQGNQVAPDTSVTGLTDQVMTANAYTTLKGYEPKSPTTQTGKFGSDHDLTFVYIKKTKIITIHPFTRDKDGNRVEIPGQSHQVEVPWTDGQTDVPVTDLPDIPYYTRDKNVVDGGYVTSNGDIIKVDMTTDTLALWVEYTPDTKNPTVSDDVTPNTNYPGQIVPVDPDGNKLKVDGDLTYTDKPGTKLPTPDIPGYTTDTPSVEVPVGGGGITVIYHKVPDTPTIPAQPIEPEQPEMPSVPMQPVEPEQPIAPVVPTQPIEPEQPAKPSVPVQSDDVTGHIVPVDPNGNPLHTDQSTSYTGTPGSEVPVPDIPGYTPDMSTIVIPNDGGDVIVGYQKVAHTVATEATPQTADLQLPDTAANAPRILSVIGAIALALMATFAHLFRPTRRRK